MVKRNNNNNNIRITLVFLNFFHTYFLIYLFFFKGTNMCANKTLCQHLCFALSETTYKCGCATGFDLDPKDSSSCIDAKSFLLYATTTGYNLSYFNSFFSLLFP